MTVDDQKILRTKTLPTDYDSTPPSSDYAVDYDYFDRHPNYYDYPVEETTTEATTTTTTTEAARRRRPKTQVGL